MLKYPWKYASDEERILRNIRVTDSGCWEWQLHRSSRGYGKVQAGGRSHRAYRLAYEAFVGPVPTGMHLDHLCRNPPCCNPEHLEPVTPHENMLRSPIHRTVTNKAKTHCDSGHEFSPENTYVRRDGCRSCRACTRRWVAESRARRLARAARVD